MAANLFGNNARLSVVSVTTLFTLILYTILSSGSSYYTNEFNQDDSVTIGIIQGSVTYKDMTIADYSPQKNREIESIYMGDSFFELLPLCDIVIFPESVVNKIHGALDFLSFQAKRTQTEFIVNSTYRDSIGLYNSIFHINSNGGVDRIYDKVNLVPFNESSLMEPGDTFNTKEIESIRTGFLLCFDILFSSAIRKLSRQEPELVIVLTNDNFAEGLSIPFLHFNYGRIYSAHYGFPILIVSQSGPSGLIMPDGSIIGYLGYKERNVAVIEVPYSM